MSFQRIFPSSISSLVTKSLSRFGSKAVVALAGASILSGCQPQSELSPEEKVYTQTQNPIVLIHGAYGFDDIFGIEYFYKILPALRSGGAKAYALTVSGANSPEVRGEQLIAKLDELKATINAEKFNLMGHSLGSPTIRYVASTRPDLVSSVTSIAGSNKGTPLADNGLVSLNVPIIGNIIVSASNGLGKVIDAVQGESFAQDVKAATLALTTPASLAFNLRHPQGVPFFPCGEGIAQVNGIYYYSWSGNKAVTNNLDPLDLLHRLATSNIPGDDDDGFVPRCSSRLGKVIRDDYPLNHLDQMNWFLTLRGADAPDPVNLYRTHANRLKLQGL